jgi:hypothetical protein
MAVRFSTLSAGGPLPLQEDSWYSFILEAESTQSHSAAEWITSIEKSNALQRGLNPRPWKNNYIYRH